MQDEKLFEIRKRATEIVVSRGYKPEDYLLLGKELPLEIAQDIISEMKHIILMEKNK